MKNLNGVLIVDKPENVTSAKVVGTIKRLLNAGKVGHAGTLDPFATGVMVCCINKATRLANFFLKDDKAYEAVLFLGVSTDTQDRTGVVVSTSTDTAFSPDTIKSAFKRFEGAIKQKPPVYSALKHEGVPLYKLARKGKPVQKPARPVHISRLDITEIRLPEIRFTVWCSAGTYIRTLCSDIGDVLGCGGHLKELRRIESSGFSIGEALAMEDIKALASAGRIGDALIDMNDALKKMPACVVEDDLADKIKTGGKLGKTDLDIPAMWRKKELFKIVDDCQRLLAVIKKDEKTDHYTYCCVVAEPS
jgi:tRNA pseudouridine55 synthase